MLEATEEEEDYESAGALTLVIMVGVHDCGLHDCDLSGLQQVQHENESDHANENVHRRPTVLLTFRLSKI